MTDPGYTNWARWVDGKVARTPWELALAMAAVGYALALLTF